MDVRFGILGPLEATVEGRPLHLGGSRAQATLATLLLAGGRVVPIEQLVDQIWGEDPPSSVRGQVAIAVHTLRKALREAGADPEVIETVGGGYRLRAVRLDAVEVEGAREQARASDPERAAELLRAALARWRGPVLAGLDSAALRVAASRWEELRLATFEDWAELQLTLGRHGELVAELTAFVGDNPLRERARGQLMLALARSGRQADALELYERGREALAEELGLDPGPSLREIRDAILRDDAPVPRQATIRPAELPPAAFAFTGRGQELDALEQLLLPGDGRHLPVSVISGVAGVGKTELALQWAHEVVDRFPDGQLFADLRGHDGQASPLRPEAVLARFLRALGVPGERIPAGLDERVALYRSTLEGRRVLVILDNAVSAAQVRPLLPGAAPCCVVVTSRSRLGGLVAHQGARALGLDVLSVEEAEALIILTAGVDRVSGERAAARRLGELCDRLPLALRIAAAKLATRSSWSVAELASRLESERGRLDELSQDELQVRGSFELSYRDLPERAKVAFRRLGLLDLPSGFAPWVVAGLLETSLPEAEELCERLVESQLAYPLGRDQAGQSRYGFHDLIRLFARERAADGDTVERYFHCLLGLIEQARAGNGSGPRNLTVSGDSPRWLPEGFERLLRDPLAWADAERPNLMAAVGHCARLGYARLARQLTSMTEFLFEMRGYYDDWTAAAELSYGACVISGDPLDLAAAEFCQGARLVHMRKLAPAKRWLDAAVTRFTEIGEQHGLAMSLRYLASANDSLGRTDLALAQLQTSLQLFREVGDKIGQASALTILTGALLHTGRAGEAYASSVEALRLAPRSGRRLRATVLKRMADVLLVQGDVMGALRACEESLVLVREINDPVGVAYVMHALGQCQQLNGDPEAEATLARALSGARRVSDPLLEGRVLLSMGTPGSLEEAAAVFAAVGAETYHRRALEAMSLATG